MRFGFVGLGFAAQRLHLPAVRSLADGEVAGAVDPAPERRREWARLGAGPVYDTVTDLLAQAGPDVVVVATPPDSHAQVCLAALEAGADVLCEKPFVATVTEADEVLRVARRNERLVAVNHEFRYMPIFASVAERVGRPGIGRPVFVQCTQLMDLPPWEEEVPWRAAMPDRALFEGGVHLVDLLRMVVGRPPVSVFAAASSGLDQSRNADAVHLVTLDYGEGLLGQITIDRLCPAGTRYVDLRVDCEGASIRSSFGGRAFIQIGVKRAQRPGVRVDFGPEGLAWVERGLRRQVLSRNSRHATVKATTALYAGAADAFRRRQEPPTSALFARETLQVIEAAYASSKTGQRVELPRQ